MRIVSKGTICRGTPGTASANSCFPAIACLPDGSLLATWRSGTTKESADGRIWLARSLDGTEWRPWPLDLLAVVGGIPGEFHYGPITVLEDGRLLIALMWTDRSDPTMPFFNPKTEGLLPMRTVFAESSNGGESWEQIRVMDTAPYHTPMPLTGAVIRGPGGMLCCPFEVNKDYYDPGVWRHAAAMKFSLDGGRDWQASAEVANDPTGRLMYWDQRHFRFEDRAVTAFWTYDREQERDANIHLSHGSLSSRTWSTPRDTGIAGQVAQPVLLKDGRLILIYVDRFGTRSIRARISRDGGESFDTDELVVHQQPGLARDTGTSSDPATYLQDMQLWTFGRVDAAVDGQGDVWTVFYCGDQHATNIAWARIRP